MPTLNTTVSDTTPSAVVVDLRPMGDCALKTGFTTRLHFQTTDLGSASVYTGELDGLVFTSDAQQCLYRYGYRHGDRIDGTSDGEDISILGLDAARSELESRCAGNNECVGIDAYLSCARERLASLASLDG